MTFGALNPVHEIKNLKKWNQGVKFGQCCLLKNAIFATLLAAQGPDFKAFKIKTKLGNLNPKSYPRNQKLQIQTTNFMKKWKSRTINPKT